MPMNIYVFCTIIVEYRTSTFISAGTGTPLSLILGKCSNHWASRSYPILTIGNEYFTIPGKVQQSNQQGKMSLQYFETKILYIQTLNIVKCMGLNYM